MPQESVKKHWLSLQGGYGILGTQTVAAERRSCSSLQATLTSSRTYEDLLSPLEAIARELVNGGAQPPCSGHKVPIRLLFLIAVVWKPLGRLITCKPPS